MNDRVGEIDVILEGGPADLPKQMRVSLSENDQERIKVPRNGGHEHFELVEQPDDRLGRPVYRWTMRTKVAE